MKQFRAFLAEVEDRPITKQQLDALERQMDALYDAIGVDVEFTRHFLDRVNDKRNKQQITIAELTALFTKTFHQYGKMLSNAKVDWEAVLNDINTKINLPFVINWNSRTKELELVSKTVMRKPDFKTRNKKLKVR